MLIKVHVVSSCDDSAELFLVDIITKAKVFSEFIEGSRSIVWIDKKVPSLPERQVNLENWS